MVWQLHEHFADGATVRRQEQAPDDVGGDLTNGRTGRQDIRSGQHARRIRLEQPQEGCRIRPVAVPEEWALVDGRPFQDTEDPLGQSLDGRGVGGRPTGRSQFPGSMNFRHVSILVATTDTVGYSSVGSMTRHGRASAAMCPAATAPQGEPVKSLARMLAHENTTSDLLALLAELDPEPMQRILGLADVDLVAEREVSTGKRGRLDLVVRRKTDDRPLAVLEMKCASDLHGDQLERYDKWAAAWDPTPSRFYCTVDGEEGGDGWGPLRLSDIFAAWQDSRAPQAAWLGAEISTMLEQWDREADGVIGDARGRYVSDIVTKRVVRELNVQLQARRDGSEASATRTSSGNPMLIAWRHDTTAPEGAWLGVDVRSQGRGGDRPWLFRPCIDIPNLGDLSLTEARLAAHDHATKLRHLMRGDALLAHLERLGQWRLAKSLRPSKVDGFRREPDDDTLARWRRLVEAEKTGRQDHPVYFHDRGLRLATQFELDVSRITRADLQDLCLTVLEHMATGQPRSA